MAAITLVIWIPSRPATADFSDTSHMRKDLTLVYGLGYQVETPPYEENAKAFMAD
jgi:hypothetical protein